MQGWNLALVGLGGGMGAMARYQLGVWLALVNAHTGFPVATLVVNVLGCLAMGVVAALAQHGQLLGPQWRVFLMTGVLGGFTTFSAFGLEALQLLRQGDVALAMLYAGSSVVLGLLAVWLGWRVVLALAA